MNKKLNGLLSLLQTKVKSNADYEKWRDIQRTQLTGTASLFFLFSSASLGFAISKIEGIHYHSIVAMSKGLRPIEFSIFYYALFMFSRLVDYYCTSLFIGWGKKADEVRKMTREIGWITWILFFLQTYHIIRGIYFMRAGILSMLFGK